MYVGRYVYLDTSYRYVYIYIYINVFTNKK